MNEPDRIIADPDVRLAAYGIPEWRIRMCKDILTKASTPEEFEKELGDQHATIDWSQALMPVFRSIYQRESDIRNRVQQALTTTAISGIIIDEYFNCGNQPYIVFNLRHEDDIPLEDRECFNTSAAQVVLDTVKSYLGLVPMTP